jgi:uncharacterized membrane protein YfcA
MPDTAALIIVTAAFLLAGAVKGIVGMGLPTVAMGLLALAMTPVQAATLLIVPSLVTNLWQMLAGPAIGQTARRLATMLIGTCIGTFIGIGFMTGGSSAASSAALGAILALYGVLGLRAVKFSVPRTAERWLSPLVGLVTGAVTGATGVFAVPAVPYLNSLGFEREELIQALGVSFTVSTLALGAALATKGAFSAGLGWHSALAIVPALLGMFAGQRVRERLRPEVFRRWFFAGLVLTGLYMMLRAAWHAIASLS